MSVDRRTIRILLASLEIEQRDVAEAMGYRPGYVANVFNGFTQPSPSFKAAFGELLAELLLGPSCSTSDCYPAGPLKELLERRVADAPSKTQFYADLGLSPSGWNKRQVVTGKLVDRICCALGVHPSDIYPDFIRLEHVS